MAIAPITGMLKRSALTNIAIGISSGIAGGYTFWYGHHIRNVQIRDAWYLEQAEAKKAQ